MKLKAAFLIQRSMVHRVNDDDHDKTMTEVELDANGVCTEKFACYARKKTTVIQHGFQFVL